FLPRTQLGLSLQGSAWLRCAPRAIRIHPRNASDELPTTGTLCGTFPRARRLLCSGTFPSQRSFPASAAPRDGARLVSFLARCLVRFHRCGLCVGGGRRTSA